MKTTVKKFLLTLSAVLLFAVLLCFNASALEPTGKCGDNVTWSYNSETGELVISGEGAMYEYGSDGTPFLSGNIKSVVIESGVTSIGDDAFRGCTSLTSVTIPDSVTSIGSYAFYNCSNIEKVYISDIGVWCNVTFPLTETYDTYYCYSNPLYYGADLYLNGVLLTNLVIPDSVTSISDYAFCNSTSLEIVTIPESVTSIGNGNFNRQIVWCMKNSYAHTWAQENNKAFALIDGTEEENVLSGSFGKFSWKLDKRTGVLEINGSGDLPDFGSTGAPWESCSNYVFKIVFSDGITGVNRLTSFSSSYIDVYFNSFYLLKTIVIPDSVTNIGDYVFSGCGSLGYVTLPDSVTSIGKLAFFRCTSLKSITIPASVTSFGTSAFSDCTSLERVTIGNSVTSIGSDAFYNCSNIEKVYITDIEAWCDISFSDYFSNPLYYGADLYLNGELLTNLVIPDSVTSIGSYAFSGCTSLTSVTIGNSVTSIGSYAFRGCTSLTSVTIGNSVTGIDSGAFNNCSNIEKVYITDIEAWCNISFSSTSYLDYYSTPLYYGADLYLNGELLTEVVIPDTITRIGKYAFYGSASIEEITIPFSVKTIDSNAFPSSLKNVMIYSKDCIFANDCGLTYNQTIYGFTGSTAEAFADQIGATFIDIETVHSHEEEIISAKPATCTEKGLTDGKKCSVCGTVTEEQKEIPATGHKEVTVKAVKPTYTKTGLTEGKKCKVCGKVTVKQKKVAKKKLKKVTISSVKSTKKATALVTWKKVTDASGYIVEYSTSKKFTKKTTKKVTIKKGKTTKTTLKKLKSGKKYYVRIRAFKTVNKKTVYGAYSSVKTVKIK